jgi:MraZ protein
MLLTGTHARTLDDKKRLALPKRIREQFGEAKELFVTPGPDQCLWIFTQDSLEKLSERLDRSSATDADARVFRRLFFARTETVDIDGNGRILIPDGLAALGNLRRDVVLIGVQHHLELWDGERWQHYEAEHGPRFDKVAEGAFQKGTGQVGDLLH